MKEGVREAIKVREYEHVYETKKREREGLREQKEERV
jgi:hypothetical protein